MIFDSHAHYDDKQFEDDRLELLLSMRNPGGRDADPSMRSPGSRDADPSMRNPGGRDGDPGEEKGEAAGRIGRIMNVGASLESSGASVALAHRYDFIYAAVGVHPSEIVCLEEAERKPYEDGTGFAGTGLTWLKLQTADEKVRAIGEIGLDYYWEKDPAMQKLQKQWFIRQLDLARECDLPVIIHSREAAADTMEIMKSHAQGIPGVIHCYSYSREMALEYVKMEYYIGVGGVVTFKNARKLIETVEAIPLERIVIETDCPYLAPVPHRGERNSSLYLPYVVERIARLKGVTPARVEKITWENACELYRL